MKKMVAIAMTGLIVLLTAFSAVQADTVRMDVSGFSDDELVVLLELVQDELVKRGIEKTATLPKGAYTAGIDIPAGKYIYTCLAKGSDWGNVTVYSEGGKGKQLLWEIVSAPKEGEEPETVFMNLNEGDQLKSGVPFSLTIQTVVKFR